MAGLEGNNRTMSWNEIPMIDKVSEKYAPLGGLTPARLSGIHCLAYCGIIGGQSVLLLHEEGNKTYLRGRNEALGLTEERVYEELRGQSVVDVAFSCGGNAYILMEDGTLYSTGNASGGRLGRPHGHVPPQLCGAVPIRQPVRRVAVGGRRVLAMTTEQVFEFGSNCYGQLGLPSCNISDEPREIYAGTGPAAPQDVASSISCSVILTVGGQVLTCGAGGLTGHGHMQNVAEMSEVPALRGHRVQQVGCTYRCTYALTDDVIYGWGANGDGQVGVGYANGLMSGGCILKPTVIGCGGRHITTFRCTERFVIAATDTGDCLFWGRGGNGVIMSPQLLTGHPLPRDVCGSRYGSGGLVFLDTKENHQRMFPATAESSVKEDSRLQKAEADITELRHLMEESIKRENETRDTRDAEIADLKRSLRESVEREKESSVTEDSRSQRAESDTIELRHFMEESIKRDNETRATRDAEIADLKCSLRECVEREKESSVTEDSRSQRAESDTIELRHFMEESIKRDNETRDAEIADLKCSLRESVEREKESSVTEDSRSQRAESDTIELRHLMEESIKRENEIRVTRDAEIADLKRSLRESVEREKESSVTEDSRLQRAEADTTELRHWIEESINRESETRDAEIADSKRSLSESVEREKATKESILTGESRLQRAESDIAELRRLMEESAKRENAAVDARVSAENALQKSNATIAKLMPSMEETLKREQAASEALRQSEHGRVSLVGRIDDLQRNILELQTARHASAEQDTRRENLFAGTIRLVEEGQLDQDAEIGELRRRFSVMQLALDAGTGHATQPQNAHQPRTDADAKVAELEKEIRELRLEKREQSVQFRSATVDYRELLMEHNSHLETCGTTPMRGARSSQQNRRGRGDRSGAANLTATRQGRH